MSKEFEEMEQSLMVEVIRRRQQPPPKQTNAVVQQEYDEEIIGTTLEQDMCVLLGGGAELSDVRLRVGAAARPAHRSVLAARAAYFEAMFRSFSPHDNIVNIQICDTVPSEEAFDSLLRYIYYGDTNMPTEDSLYLFQAPIYYGFTNNRLQVFCKHNLQSNVSPENVLAILQAADRMRATDIKEYALKMIVHHFGLVSSALYVLQTRLQVFCKHNLQSNVSPENVLAILQAADRMRATDIKEYALKMIVHHFGLVSSALYVLQTRLQVFCKHNLQSNVSPENVLAILQAADRMRATDIKEYALKMIVHHFGLSNVSPENVLAILQAADRMRATDIKEYALKMIVHHFGLVSSALYVLQTRLQVFCKHNLQSNVSPENVLAILQAADRMRATDIKEYALKMIVHHFGLVSSALYVLQTRLQVFCKHNLQSNVSPENVLAILQAADRMRATDIKEYALKMIVHHFGLSNVSPENVLAILQAADRMRATDIKEYALKMIVHHFGLVARQDAIKNLAQPLLVDIIWALADEPHFDSPLPVQPRSLPSSSSADTLTDDPDYSRHRCGKS
ncbi:hypothetical protein PYW07_008342 [Mythimna separata]|uniref:BTB domain-containing protein n=1 Tax=Mythimna separata TaxID=271217 RepID=A0AAD7YCI7_MYTSE|nr:hypothetical protein PYW07_008342 [Mythimna separata]